MIAVAPNRPWTPERSRVALPGRVVFRVASGEAPERVPHYLEVARGRASAPLRFDGGPVDRALRRFSPAIRVSRAFEAAAGGLRERDWDEVEDATGLSRTFRLELDPDADLLPVLDALASLAHVESCAPHYLSATPFALGAPAEATAEPDYAHAMVGAEAALRFEPGDGTLIVAIVDSGVALEHAELRDKLRPGIDTVDLPSHSASAGLRLIGDTSDPDRVPRDDMGHGTACASIIGALGHRVPAGIGGAAQLLPARALAAARLAERSKLTAIGSIPDIDAAVKTAVDLGARVLNLSFGTPETALRDDDPVPHAEVVEYARRRGCVLVAASGNEGTAIRYFPAAAEGVIAVGSVGPDGTPSAFSSRGDHVDLSAPGEAIPTAGRQGYTRQTGTSFAAPFVAGACALLLARAARYGHPLDADDLRLLLRTSARPFATGTPPRGSGAGVLDIPAALDLLERVLAARAAPQPGLHLGYLTTENHRK